MIEQGLYDITLLIAATVNVVMGCSLLDGNSSYRNYLIDAVYNLTADQLQEGAKYEMR